MINLSTEYLEIHKLRSFSNGWGRKSTGREHGSYLSIFAPLRAPNTCSTTVGNARDKDAYVNIINCKHCIQHTFTKKDGDNTFMETQCFSQKQKTSNQSSEHNPFVWNGVHRFYDQLLLNDLGLTKRLTSSRHSLSMTDPNKPRWETIYIKNNISSAVARFISS